MKSSSDEWLELSGLTPILPVQTGVWRSTIPGPQQRRMWLAKACGAMSSGGLRRTVTPLLHCVGCQPWRTAVMVVKLLLEVAVEMVFEGRAEGATAGEAAAARVRPRAHDEKPGQGMPRPWPAQGAWGALNSEALHGEATPLPPAGLQAGSWLSGPGLAGRQQNRRRVPGRAELDGWV